MNRDVEVLPLDAKPKYDCDPKLVIWYIAPDRTVAKQEGDRFFTCPLLQVTPEEARELEAKLVRESGGIRDLRVIDAGGGLMGFFGGRLNVGPRS